MPDPRTNLCVLKRTRRKPESGDVFAMQLSDERYLFGRVIGADLPLGRAPMPGAYLIYVYQSPSADKVPDFAELIPDRLLFPPEFTNRMPWTKGYFETIDHRPLQPHDLLRQHCFKRFTGEYLDEGGNRLPTASEPCGEWGLGNHRTLDDSISDALGIPRAPD